MNLKWAHCHMNCPLLQRLPTTANSEVSRSLCKRRRRQLWSQLLAPAWNSALGPLSDYSISLYFLLAVGIKQTLK